MNIQGLNNYNLQSNYINNRKYSLKQDETIGIIKPNEISFKSSKETKLGKWLSKFFGEHYGKPMADKEWIQDCF